MTHSQYNSSVMSILKVARMGHPVLRTRRGRIDRVDVKSPAIQRLIDDMFDTMAEYHGVGLAAPQIHEERAAVRRGISIPPDEAATTIAEPLAIINPEIIPVGDEIVEDWEGCLSIPDIRGRVPRLRERSRCAPTIARASASSSVFRTSRRASSSMRTDHLDGVLFFDRMRVVRFADVPRRVRALLGQGPRLGRRPDVRRHFA